MLDANELFQRSLMANYRIYVFAVLLVELLECMLYSYIFN
jgi:hypothetical protein